MKKEKAITLMSLVITIILLIILAGIGINLSIGENGIFKKAKEARDKYITAQEDEEKQLNKVSNYIDGNYKQIASNFMFIDVDNMIEEGNGANYTYTAKEDSIAYINANGTNVGYSAKLNDVEVFYFLCAGNATNDGGSTLISIKKGQKLTFTQWGTGSGSISTKIYKILN